MDNLKLTKAIEILGGPANTARQLGCSIQAVLFWRDGKRELPADKCPTIERLTGGLIRAEELRPDVEWSVIRTPKANCEAA